MQKFYPYILQATGSKSIITSVTIQSLWSDYGQISKLSLASHSYPSVVVKHIKFPTEQKHPRGWNTSVGHERKVTSYQVENIWYQHWAQRCSKECGVPLFLGYHELEEEKILVLEDLDAAGFSVRKFSLEPEQSKVALKWLAHFHASFMCEKPKGIWPKGTYWHLATRQEEWAAMTESPLKKQASQIDAVLNACTFQTIVHGDAKVANFCFSEDLQMVAAVDFQYVGGGCGIKDVAYFLGSCLSDSECQQYTPDLLEYYLAELAEALKIYKPKINASAVLEEYRDRYALAWTDFTRFLMGWNPGHQKLNGYSEQLMHQAVAQL